MAKIKIKGVEELAKSLNRNLRIKFNILFRDKVLRKKIGAMVVADIKKNVDMGPAAKSTVKWRNTHDKLNTTDPAYKPTRVKAVFTGELLKDLGNSVLSDPTEYQFIVEHSDKLHSRYKGKNGPIGKKIAYSKLSEYLIDDMGYDYLQLSDTGKKQITKLIKDEIVKLLA
jgi:hypothetical protein